MKAYDEDDEIMSAEEFFGGIAKSKNAPAKISRKRRKRTADDLFQEAKLRMVMRIYGVSRAKALEIIAARAKKSEDGVKSGDCQATPSGNDELTSVEEFFRC